MSDEAWRPPQMAAIEARWQHVQNHTVMSTWMLSEVAMKRVKTFGVVWVVLLHRETE
jgi:hypothetical protein